LAEKKGTGHGESGERRFDRWAPTYEKGILWKRFFLPLYEHLMEALPEVGGMRVLDVGCGTGALALRLVERDAMVVGVDASEGMIEVAKRKAEDREGLDFRLAPAEALPLEDDSFDLAISSIAFHHFEDAAAALGEVMRVLKRGCAFYVCDMCGEGLLGRASLRYGRIVGTDYRYYSRRELSELMGSAGFVMQEVSLLRKIPPVMLAVGLKPS